MIGVVEDELPVKDEISGIELFEVCLLGMNVSTVLLGDIGSKYVVDEDAASGESASGAETGRVELTEAWPTVEADSADILSTEFVEEADL